MALVEMAVHLGIVVGVMLAMAVLAIVGRSRIARTRSQYRERLRTVAPHLLLLGGVLVVNDVARNSGHEVSWLIGWNITSRIYAIEGTFVASLQSLIPAQLVPLFSFVYVYGYVFLLVFPIVAYFALDETRYLRETCLAYVLNYGIGLLCYVAFIAYGPRNLLPDVVGGLLYTTWPQSQLLTSQVNANTNVFPSLHSSLSITVALLAYRTREVYPEWLPVAAILAGSIVVSTMYLGIHWLVDVVAGGGLALLAVRLAVTVADDATARRRGRRSDDRLSALVDRWVRALRDR